MSLTWALLTLLASAPASRAADPASFPTVVEALQKLPEMHSFDAADGTHLVYSVIGGTSPGKLGPLVIAEGKGETALRYLQFAGEMQAKGYGPVFILDHRSQGFSGQTLANAVHVEDFHDYVKDFIRFLEGPVKSELAERGIAARPNVIAHSMGGAIMNLTLRERPDLVNRVAYVTPMFQIRLGGHEDLLNKPVEWVSGGARLVGLGEHKIGMSMDRYHPAVTPAGANLMRAEKLEYVLNVRTPQQSITWVNEALKAGDQVRSAEGRPANPSILFAGKQDKLVSSQAIHDYACTSAGCTFVELNGAHVLHEERDSVRRKLETDIDDFFQGRASLPASACENLFSAVGGGS